MMTLDEATDLATRIRAAGDETASHADLVDALNELATDVVDETRDRETRAPIISGELRDAAHRAGTRCGSASRPGCDRPILFTTVDGVAKPVPLDPRPACYRVTDIEEGERTIVNAIRDHQVAVTHFATCPQASDFSRSRKP